MIATTINSEPIFLIPHAPVDTMRVGLSIATNVTRALGGATTRRPRFLLPRWSLEWSSRILGSEFDRLRAAARTDQNQRVAVPHWLFARRAGETAFTTSGHVVAWSEDWTTWAIDPGSLAAFDYVAPLLLGYLAPTRLEAMNDEGVTAALSFDEDSDAGDAVSIAAGVLPADTMFATSSGYSAPVFPFIYDPTTAPTPGLHQVAVERPTTGPGRRKVQVFYPQKPEEAQKTTFRLHGAVAAAQLAAWWIRRRGGAGAHWVAGTQAIARLATPAAAGASALVCDAASVAGDTYVALFDPAGALELARVTSWDGSVANLAAPLQSAWSPAQTTIAPAFLARHTDKELTFDCVRTFDGWLAGASLNWREVAAEYSLAAGETRGVTIGELPPRAYFFQIDLDYAGAMKSWYLTNWESGATANLIDWTYNACDVDKLIRSIDLEDDSFTLDFRWFPNGPWENWQTGQLHARGFVTIYRADVSAGGAFINFRQIAKGELVEPSGQQPQIRQRALGANALYSLTVPRGTMGKPCRTTLFSTLCGQNRSDWTFSAVISAAADNVVTVGSIARTNGSGMPADFGATDWFALGYMEWLTDGVPMRASIVASTALAGGSLQISLELASPIGAGSSVKLVPGCDRLRSSGCTKFANTANHQGFDDIPAINPAFVLPSRKFKSAKK